jgi:hypothetical protein
MPTTASAECARPAEICGFDERRRFVGKPPAGCEVARCSAVPRRSSRQQKRAINSVEECQLPKLEAGVRVPSPAPLFSFNYLQPKESVNCCLLRRMNVNSSAGIQSFSQGPYSAIQYSITHASRSTASCPGRTARVNVFETPRRIIY